MRIARYGVANTRAVEWCTGIALRGARYRCRTAERRCRALLVEDHCEGGSLVFFDEDLLLGVVRAQGGAAREPADRYVETRMERTEGVRDHGGGVDRFAIGIAEAEHCAMSLLHHVGALALHDGDALDVHLLAGAVDASVGEQVGANAVGMPFRLREDPCRGGSVHVFTVTYAPAHFVAMVLQVGAYETVAVGLQVSNVQVAFRCQVVHVAHEQLRFHAAFRLSGGSIQHQQIELGANDALHDGQVGDVHVTARDHIGIPHEVGPTARDQRVCAMTQRWSR